MPAVTLAPAKPEHIPHVLALLRKCDLPETGVVEGISGFVVAHANGELVGCCGLEIYGSDGLLRSVAVCSRSRKQGIATSLLDDAFTRSIGGRLSAIFLLTTTAQSYFPRFGFEVFPRDRAPDGIRGSWEFQRGCSETAVFMRKVLVHVR